jgi:hypothetical protein
LYCIVDELLPLQELFESQGREVQTQRGAVRDRDEDADGLAHLGLFGLGINHEDELPDLHLDPGLALLAEHALATA